MLFNFCVRTLKTHFAKISRSFEVNVTKLLVNSLILTTIILGINSWNYIDNFCERNLRGFVETKQEVHWWKVTHKHTLL